MLRPMQKVSRACVCVCVVLYCMCLSRCDGTCMCVRVCVCAPGRVCWSAVNDAVMSGRGLSREKRLTHGLTGWPTFYWD